MSIRDFQYRIYWRLEKIIVPKLRSSQYEYYEALRSCVPNGCDWLDLGCGHQMFGQWMHKEETELSRRADRLVGIDLDSIGLPKNSAVRFKVFGNLEALPFDSASFDIVSANMVVEHLDRPGLVLGEIRRVLRPNGLFVCHTPNARCVPMRVARLLPQGLKTALVGILEGRKEEDVFPTLYRLNTTDDIARIAAAGGFELNMCRLVSSSAATAVFGALSVFELLYLRMIEAENLKELRSNFVFVLRKPALT